MFSVTLDMQISIKLFGKSSIVSGDYELHLDPMSHCGLATMRVFHRDLLIGLTRVTFQMQNPSVSPVAEVSPVCESFAFPIMLRCRYILYDLVK